MRTITKVRRSVKAISPVISVLLMIAIAVAASLVAYAWVMGYLDFTTTKVGKAVLIQSVSTDAVYVQNVGDSDVTLKSCYINGNLDALASAQINGVLLAKSKTQAITSFSYADAFDEKQVTVKIVTSDGTSAEYTNTFSGSSSSGGPGTTTYPIDFLSSTGGSMNYAPGTHQLSGTISITAIEAVDYDFVQWVATGGISILDVNDPTTTATITDAGTIMATFTPEEVTYAVTIEYATGGQSVSPASGSYAGAVPISAVATQGYGFAQWQSSTGFITFDDEYSATTTANINGAGTITATFAQDQYSLTVNIVGSGSVDRDVAGPYVYGTDVELTADANDGWTFSGWSDDLSGSANPETITMDDAKTVTATFTQNEYTLTINTVGSGSVAKLPDQATYHYGDIVELTANPAASWTFTSWTGGLTGSTNPDTLTITDDVTVTATFTYVPPTTTLLSDGFEVTGYAWDNNWDGNGGTSWEQSSNKAHSGSYSARSKNGDEGYFTTDTLSTSGATSVTVSFWMYHTNIGSSDLQLIFRDAYWHTDSIASLGDTGSNDEWTYYTITTTDSQYLHSNFCISLLTSLGSGEYVYIDDVLITRTP